MINFLSHFTCQNGRESERMEKQQKNPCVYLYTHTHSSETHVKCVHMIYFFHTQLVSAMMLGFGVLRVRHFKFVRLTYLFAFILASIIWMKWDVANFQLNVARCMGRVHVRSHWDCSRSHNVSAEEHQKQYNLAVVIHFQEGQKNTQWKPKS